MAKIELENVSVEFPVYNVNARSFKKKFLHLATGGKVVEDARHHVVVKALNDINLTIEHGDVVGLIGHNGAGKSTFMRLLASIYEPTHGTIRTTGHISPMLDLSPGIEMELSGYDNILMRGALLGLSKAQIKKQITEIAELTGLGDYLAMPIRTYSSGMLVRLAFAITSNVQPDILIIDEIFGAGDAAFMVKAREKMVSLLKKSSIVVLATHADELIKEFCNKVILLEQGKVKYYGAPEEGLKLYQQN